MPTLLTCQTSRVNKDPKDGGIVPGRNLWQLTVDDINQDIIKKKKNKKKNAKEKKENKNKTSNNSTTTTTATAAATTTNTKICTRA